ncbi:MAG TPA: protease inhibitor I42 family protein, partial [Methanomicrobiales archaeon]|nr:protease inhibitor I42 family protein [Methanomicrobiales archaeon]
MKSMIAMAAGLALCLALILSSGCVGTDISAQKGETTPEPTQEVAGATYLFDNTNNGETYYVQENATIKLTLPENPTTGYQWELNTSPGLVITKDEYIPDATSGQVVGAGGKHVWYMTAKTEGIKTIQGVYRRSFEAVTGNETSFSLHLFVVPPGEAVPYLLLTLNENGSTVEVQPNQTFRILLPENPSTGFEWMIDFPAGLLVQDQGYIADETATPMVGSGGYHYWDVTAIGSGDQKISGIYVQPWASYRYGNETRFVVTIRIKDENGTELHIFDAADNGKTVTVGPGSIIKVMLEENPSTGYSWVMNTT